MSDRKGFRLLLALLVLFSGAAAGQSSLERFLAPLEKHPALNAARAVLIAAEAQLEVATSPVQLGLNAGYSLMDVNEVDLDPTAPGVQGLDDTAASISADLTLRPFAFGDVADAVVQRRVAVEQARLDYLETLAGLQIRALEAAQGVNLARQGLEVATAGEQLAAEALAATRLRLERGAATERELRNAEAGLQEARNQLEAAIARLDLAEASLRGLVGEAALPAGADAGLPKVEGVPLQLARARLQLQLAELAPRAAERALIPTVQASYTRNLSESDSVSVSLESRTLQPSVSYEYRSPPRTFPQTEVEGSFQIGVSLTISPAVFDALEAARQQRDAAAQGFEAARLAADLQLASLENARQLAQRSVELAELRLQNARLDLEETQQRQRAGLAIPLEVLQASLAVTTADLELSGARQELQGAIHDLYEFHGQPPHLDDFSEARR